MIKVVFYKCGNEYYGFRETGHAEFDDEGKARAVVEEVEGDLGFECPFGAIDVE